MNTKGSSTKATYSCLAVVFCYCWALAFLLLAPPPAAANDPFTVIQVIDTSSYPSPDPAGIVYLPNQDALLMTDSEINEMSIFQGDNAYLLDRFGTLLNTFDTLDFSDEPTGITVDPVTGHCFISDDTGTRSIYEIDPGADNTCLTGDDSVTSFGTGSFNSNDPEDVTLAHGALYVLDGVNTQVYILQPGPNGQFDGAPPEGDDVVSSFDTSGLGLTDPEGITYSQISDTLYIVGEPRLLVEASLSGQLVRSFDLSGLNIINPAAVTLAPSSIAPAMTSAYVAARGVDNDSDPNENDGKIFELQLGSMTPGNEPPVIDAGSDQSIMLPQTAQLDGTVSDDGLPDGTLIITWSQVSGPGTASFANTNQPSTEVSFSSSGNYQLRLSASDGELSVSDELTVDVSSINGSQVFTKRITSSSDDAEQRTSGSMRLTSSDLELGEDSTPQIVGMRFTDTAIPQGATIDSAYIQFQVDESDTVETVLLIEGEAADNAATFTSDRDEISARPKTNQTATWQPAPWPTVGEAGLAQRSADIRYIIQQIVNRPGWSSGNALALYISGYGTRTAESYDGDESGAPLLRVEYTVGSNQPPLVSIDFPGDNLTFTEGAAITFSGTASDFEDGDLASGLSWSSSIDGLLGTGAMLTTTLSVGTHTLTASAMDSAGLQRMDSVIISVLPDVPVLVAAGDIAGCDDEMDLETSLLLDAIPGTVLTLGDNAYEDGSAAEFANCYDPTWGRHKARTFAVPGNHDYHTPDAADYFHYFGEAAGEPGMGYYSFDKDGWHIIALNSECREVGGCEADSPQGQWLQADLAANPSTCILAYWHEPLFTSNERRGNDFDYQDFWEILYAAGADIVLNGDAHNYERFGKQTPTGVADPQRGIREFIVGTGGRTLYGFTDPQPNSEVREDSTFGVLKLTLHPDSYDWEFVPIAGQTFTDSGSDTCVQAPNAPVVMITAPEDGAQLTAGELINFSATATDVEDGDVAASLLWESDLDGMLGSGSMFSSVLTTGVHTITAMVADSELLEGSDSIVVSVGEIPLTLTTESRVSGSSNDAEERASGDMKLTSSDLELVFDGGGNQTVGMRFTNVQVPPGATVVRAYVQFQTDESNTDPTSLLITGEAASNAAGFTSQDGNITTRPTTAMSVLWSPPPWTVVGAAGAEQQTPELRDVIQEIIELSGWQSGNAMVLLVSGSGERTAESFDGRPEAAPLLHIEYIPGQQPPSVDAGADQTVDLADIVQLNGVITDDGLPEPPGQVTSQWSLVSGPGTVNFADPSLPDTTATFSAPGSYLLRLSANDGELISTDEVSITVLGAGGETTISVSVASSNDDAEERSSGKVVLNSSDLELVFDANSNQTVGMRFTGVAIPPGSAVQSAYIQFQTDEETTGATSLQITAQAEGNAAAFTSANGDISSRPTTSMTVNWTPAPWTTRGEAGPAQQTPDLSPVLAEVIGHTDWASGNAVVFVITGSGERTAESFDGEQSGAPVLHVEFTAP